MPARRDPQSHRLTKLARLRTQAGVTQQELADATGISLAKVYRLETGLAQNPKIRDLATCAVALGYRLEDLLEDEWLGWSDLDGRHPEPPDPATFPQRGQASWTDQI